MKPTHEPRATEYIHQMIQMIEHLIFVGHAYRTSGHVLFDVASKSDYGKLSRRSLDEMIAGARVEVAPYKKNPMDFVLWKPSDPDQPGWHSPWGMGRPGWHIECSAMADALLGETFDIHGGGIDLLFPHHENEIAQSEGAHADHPPARYWMHNGFLQVEGEKMSKSLGNFVTIRELLRTTRFGEQRWSGEILRFAMLQTHYREPIDWTVSGLQQADRRLTKWRSFAGDRTDSKIDKEALSSVLSELLNDMNTPSAFAQIDQIVSGRRGDDRSHSVVYKLLKLLGFKGPRSKAVNLSDLALRTANKLQKFPKSSWSELELRPLHDEEQHGIEHVIANLTILSMRIRKLMPLIGGLSDVPEIARLLELRREELYPQWRKDTLSSESIRSLDADLARLNRALYGMSSNDWLKYAEIARYQPFLSSGKRRAATDLVFSMLLLADVAPYASTINRQVVNFALLESLKQRYEELERPDLSVDVHELIDARNAARKAKNFGESDRIRDELLAKGIQLKDNPDGTTTWEVKR
jgi:cysteinyl-tRNA synthetase